MQADRMFDFYTDAGILTLSVSCGEAKLIGRLEGETNQPTESRLDPVKAGGSPDVARKSIGPEPFEGETEAIILQAARRWVENRIGPVRATRERGCEPE